MNILNECSYTLEKSLYKKKYDIAIIYVQYVLKTPECNLNTERLKYINEWENALNNASVNFIENIQYRDMENIFSQ